MILLLNPRATRPKNRRFPLSLLALGAALPPDVSWEILDGNLPDSDLEAEVATRVAARALTDDPVTLIAMTVMPGPQLVSAVPLARRLKERFPRLPDRVGRLLPDPLPRARAARAVRRLPRARPGRTHARRAARRSRGTPRSRGRRGPRLEGRRRGAPQPGAGLGGPRRVPGAALEPDRRRDLSPADRPRETKRRLPGLDRVSVHVQLLRRHRRRSEASRNSSRPRAPRRTSRIS